MMQVIKVIVVIFLLGGCKTPDIITVKLETAKENDGLLGSSQVGLNKESKDIDTYQKFAKQYKLDTFLVFSYSHSPEEYYYNQYLSGEISLDFFSKIINLYNIDTLKVRYTQYDAQSLILLGLKKNGDCVIVADENNNNDFYDDSFHTIENWFNENRKLSPDSLPYVTINNLISNYNNKKTIFSTSYYIKPLKRDSSMMLNHKPISEINISLISDEYLYGVNTRQTNPLSPFQIDPLLLIVQN